MSIPEFSINIIADEETGDEMTYQIVGDDEVRRELDLGAVESERQNRHEPERVGDPNAVKVVRDQKERALYFSRSPIPHPRDEQAAAGQWRLHLGIYGFRREVLRRFVTQPPSRRRNNAKVMPKPGGQSKIFLVVAEKSLFPASTFPRSDSHRPLAAGGSRRRKPVPEAAVP